MATFYLIMTCFLFGTGMAQLFPFKENTPDSIIALTGIQWALFLFCLLNYIFMFD